MNPITVSWETESHDGFVLKERDGHKYREIDRANLKSFRLIAPGKILFETFTDPSHPGLSLCYRRRTIIKQSTNTKAVFYIVGWVPMGPVFVLDAANEEGFIYEQWGDGNWSVPQPIPEEGEAFTFNQKRNWT